MNVMICFEVSGKQEQIRKELSALGYMSNWRIVRGRDELTFNLPSNAMWRKGENMSPAKAKEDLKKAASQHKVKVVRGIAVVVGKWDGMTGENQGAESQASAEHAEA